MNNSVPTQAENERTLWQIIRVILASKNQAFYTVFVYFQLASIYGGYKAGFMNLNMLGWIGVILPALFIVSVLASDVRAVRNMLREKRE